MRLGMHIIWKREKNRLLRFFVVYNCGERTTLRSTVVHGQSQIQIEFSLFFGSFSFIDCAANDKLYVSVRWCRHRNLFFYVMSMPSDTIVSQAQWTNQFFFLSFRCVRMMPVCDTHFSVVDWKWSSKTRIERKIEEEKEKSIRFRNRIRFQP